MTPAKPTAHYSRETSPKAAKASKWNGKRIREAAKDVLLEVETPERTEDVVDEQIDDDKGDVGAAEDGSDKAEDVDDDEGESDPSKPGRGRKKLAPGRVYYSNKCTLGASINHKIA
jgi:hypothetical protein